MTAAALDQSLLSLPVPERIALADRLYASVPEEWLNEADQAWLKEAEQRSAEMDTDLGMALSPEEFMAGLEIHRHGA